MPILKEQSLIGFSKTGFELVCKILVVKDTTKVQLEMHFIKRMSLREIAAEVGLSQQNIRQNIKTFLTHFKKNQSHRDIAKMIEEGEIFITTEIPLHFYNEFHKLVKLTKQNTQSKERRHSMQTIKILLAKELQSISGDE